MKRSEMLKELTLEIIVFDNTIKINQAQFFADVLLTKIEKLGMRPTARIIGSNHENDLWNLALYDWEPENE